MQARLVSNPLPNLLLLDVLNLQNHHGSGVVQHMATARHGSIQLLPDPGMGDCVFVSLPHAAFSVRFAWMPALAHAFQQGALPVIPLRPA